MGHGSRSQMASKGLSQPQKIHPIIGFKCSAEFSTKISKNLKLGNFEVHRFSLADAPCKCLSPLTN